MQRSRLENTPESTQLGAVSTLAPGPAIPTGLAVPTWALSARAKPLTLSLYRSLRSGATIYA